MEISDETERCPLCGSVLEYTGEVENMYPDVRVYTRKMTMISKIYLFCALLVEVLLIYINVVTESQIAWSAITGLGFFYGYMLIRFAILGKTGYRAKITVLTLMAILIVIAIDFLVGYRGWSVNYALPSAIILVDVGIIICMIVNRRNWQSYMMWQIFMILCSIVPVILIFTGIVTAQLFALIAFAFSLFLFLGTLIIGDRRARVNTQLRKQVSNHKNAPFHMDLFHFDFEAMTFYVGDSKVELSKTEQKLLRLLVENRGRTMTRGDLVDRIWTDGAEYVDENALSVTIKRLRDKLGAQKYIKTVYGIGYSWVTKDE